MLYATFPADKLESPLFATYTFVGWDVGESETTASLIAVVGETSEGSVTCVVIPAVSLGEFVVENEPIVPFNKPV